MRNYLHKYRWLIPPFISFAVNMLVYCGSRMIVNGKPHYCMDNILDGRIPFLPPFILVYFGCYLFWTVNYCLIARMEAEHCSRFYTADLYAKLVCFLFFILLPTTNIRPELTDQDIWTWLVRFLYDMDAPTNLFPSIHCLTSWFCYIGIRNRKEIPL